MPPFRRPYAAALAVLLIGALASACGGPSLTSGLRGGVFDNKSPAAPAAWAPQVTTGSEPTAAFNPTRPGECAKFAALAPDKTITVYEGGRLNDQTAIIYRAEVTRTARECELRASSVVVRYGFEGRLILGPQGKSGVVTVSAVVNVMDPSKARVKSDAVKIPVQVTLEEPVGYFSVVREVEVPLAAGASLKDYQLNVSFEKKTPGAA
ncbi:MAG: hypothetical protein NW215_01625 [Hyphomicrobiales bacterium]|nr:hypothetical protein [Hyphomicrobiales bacterium]